MKINPLFLTIFIALFFLSACESLPKHDKKEIVIKSEKDGFPYFLVFSEHSISQKIPLILVLHGRGVRVDNYLQKWRDEIDLNDNAMLLFLGWEVEGGKRVGLSQIYDLLEDVQKEYQNRIDSEKIYVAGISAGGLYARLLMDRDPNYWRGGVFMAYIPTLGWTQQIKAQSYPNLFFLIGEKDTNFQASSLPEKVQTLKEKGVKVSYRIEPAVGHEQARGWANRVLAWILADN